jgi:IMP dehydrogenase
MLSEKVNKRLALSFDDVLLVPSRSNVLPADVNIETRLTKKIKLKIPIISSAMDTVTESRLAIAIAQEGGIGIIHRNMPIEKQAEEVRKVKKFESWIIKDPITLSPDDTLAKAKEIYDSMNISSFPIVKDGKLVGIVTSRDMLFEDDQDKKLEEIMTKDIFTVIEDEASMENAVKIMKKSKIEKIPVIDKSGKIKGLITASDIEKSKKFPNASKDGEGRLVVGAAVGPFDMERVKALVNAEADVIVVDTAHGHSENVIKMVMDIKKNFDIDVIAGKVVTPEATKDLIEAGGDAVKVGVGPGSICTTRVVAGVGIPQVTAIHDCSEIANKYEIPIIADGGVRYSGDIAKAIAAGAHTVMLGSLLAGTEESPGRAIFVGGRKYKSYRGMGSVSAMQEGSKDRYFQKDVPKRKLVPEGVEGIVPYRGTLSEMVRQLIGGLKSAMGYSGCRTIDELRKNGRFTRITKMGKKESHPHDIIITEESPNYWKDNANVGLFNEATEKD